jgi:hypothetical protein
VRAHLGWLTFLLAIAFATCLVAALVGSTWFALPNTKGILGFFGFGIHQWRSEPRLRRAGMVTSRSRTSWGGRRYGRACVRRGRPVPGAGCVFSDRSGVPGGPVFWRLLGFRVTALVRGGFCIAILYEAEGN